MGGFELFWWKTNITCIGSFWAFLMESLAPNSWEGSFSDGNLWHHTTLIERKLWAFLMESSRPVIGLFLMQCLKNHATQQVEAKLVAIKAPACMCFLHTPWYIWDIFVNVRTVEQENTHSFNVQANSGCSKKNNSSDWHWCSSIAGLQKIFQVTI